MLLTDFIKWWYGPGWVLRFSMLFKHIENQLDYFSVPILLKTFFSPWRQNISGAKPNGGLAGIFAPLVDNTISRLVGATVRFFALLAAIVTVLVVFVLNAIYVIVWPVLPFLPVILIAFGVSYEA